MRHFNDQDETRELIRDRKKIAIHPASIQKRLDHAIEIFDSADSADVALEEFLALIDVGCIEACFFVGCIYEEGGNNMPPDLNKALYYYQRSADELGYIEGYLALGRLYYYGIGVNKDYQKSFDFYSIVSENRKNPIAHMMLGRMSQYGRGIEVDLLQAKKHYEMAIETGSVYAIRDLGVLEQSTGNWLLGWILRLKAGLSAFLIGIRNIKDYRLRQG